MTTKIRSAIDYIRAESRHAELCDRVEELDFSEQCELEQLTAEMASWNNASRSPLQHRDSPEMGGAFRTTPQSEQDCRLLQCVALGQLSNSNPWDVARELGYGASLASSGMSANSHSSGGSWIAGGFSERFIESLRPMSVVRQIAGVITVDDGSLVVPKARPSEISRFLGEKEPANVETIATGDVKLVLKELVGAVLTTEKLLRSTSANALQRIYSEVLREVAVTEDLYFLRGAASGAGPTGLRSLGDPTQIIAAASGATPAIAVTDAELAKLEVPMMDANLRMETAAWVMSPRTFIYLQNLRDGNGNLVYPGLSLAKPMLRGKRVFYSTLIPSNLGSGADESEIMLVNGEHVLIGDSPSMQLDVSNTAAYTQNGTVHAAFTERKAVVRAVKETDIVLRHTQAVATLVGVRWGAS